MPNSPIPFSNLTAATLLDGSEIIPIVQGGASKRTTVAQVAASPISDAMVTATGTTTARTLADRFAGSFNVKDFGAIGDGNSHPLSGYYSTLTEAQAVYPTAATLTEEIDSAAIRTALLEASAISKACHIPAGRYRINAALVTFDQLSNVKVVGDGPGITTLVHEITPVAGVAYMFNDAGDWGSTQTISAPISAGATTVTLPNVSGFTVDEYVRLVDPAQPLLNHEDATTAALTGEQIRIRSIVGTTLTLWSATEFAYGATSTARSVTPLSNWSINNLTVEGGPNDVGAGQRVIALTRVDKLRLHRVEFVGITDQSVRIAQVVDFQFTLCESRDLRSDLAYTPYMFHIFDGCSNGLIHGCIGHRGRHLVTLSTNATGIENSFIRITDCVALENYLAGFDTHPQGSRHVTFANCQVHGVTSENLSPGFQLRGRYTTILNPQSVRQLTGISLIYGENNEVVGGTIDGCTTGIIIQNSPGNVVRGTRIRNVTTTGVSVVLDAGDPATLVDNTVLSDVEVTGDPTGYAFDFGSPSVWRNSCRIDNLLAPSATRKYRGIPNEITYPGYQGATAKFETFSRRHVATTGQAIGVSGQLFLVAIDLPKDELLTHISLTIGGTSSGLTNMWFSLYDSSRNLLGVTADQGAVEVNAGTTYELALSSAFRTTYKGLHYLGIVAVATVTMPTVRAFTVSSNVVNIAPILCGTSTGSLTNPASAPNPAGVISATSVFPYMTVR
jgi:hypothetical protein